MHNNLNDQKRDKAKGIKEKYALFSKYPIHEYIVRKGAKNLSSLKAIIDVERNSLNVKDENDNTPLMLLVETQWLEGLELVFTELKNYLFKFDMLQYSRIMT